MNHLWEVLRQILVHSPVLGFGTILGIGGSLLGGLFGGGGTKNQQQGPYQKTDQSQTTGSQTGSSQTTGTSQSTSTPTEADYFSKYRESLIGPYQQLLAKAQAPVYGQAEQAQYLNNLNTMANKGLKNLASQISSRTGNLDSGAFGAGAGNIEAGREGAAAQYNLQTPMLNKQAYQQNVGSVLGMGMNFAGRAPVGNTTTGATTANVQTQQQNQQNQNNVENYVPGQSNIPWWQRMLGGLGGLSLPGGAPNINYGPEPGGLPAGAIPDPTKIIGNSDYGYN